MADEFRNGDSKVRVVRLLGHRDDAGAWEIRDFLKRSVVEFQWIELSTEEDSRRELGLSDLKNVNLPVVELPDGTRLFGPTLRDVADRLGFVTKPKRRQSSSVESSIHWNSTTLRLRKSRISHAPASSRCPRSRTTRTLESPFRVSSAMRSRPRQNTSRSGGPPSP